jgi:maleylacetoacetate isomerase|tara:strand:- start:1001 stop:1627 length:627 start_codon:yes stop_codon:yes gene_type:complete
MIKDLILYDYPKSSASYRVRIALNLKAIDYQQVYVDLINKDQNSTFYLATNPQGLVPSLTVGDQIITQSIAIIEWLEETYPQPSLLPSNPIKKAQLRAQAYIIACDTHPLNNLRVLNYLIDDMALDNSKKMAWYHHWITLAFSAIEVHLDATEQINQANLLDVLLVPQVFNAQRFNLNMSPYSNINQRVSWCNQLPAFQQAHPDQNLS